jgi:D-alanyl-D-alanine carboxypeptidase (penicillin-binding protein 5/6)
MAASQRRRIAKVITALCVLSKKPLAPGQQGPAITLSQRDTQIYDSYFAKNGSIVPVRAGETISEYQAFEGMMLPSADNLADTLAIWAFGSLDNYVTYANAYVNKLGLSQTTVADASGLSQNTASTAHDLVLLGIQAIKNPALAAVVNEQLATIPVAGTVYNYLLGTDGVIGIKTGNTDEAGGCLLFAASRSIKGRTLTVVGAVMGAPDYSTAIKDSQPLIAASDNGFELRKVVSAGSVVGKFSAPWGASADAVVLNDLSLLVWKGATPAARTNLQNLQAPAAKGQQVGSVSLVSGGRVSTVPVVLTKDIKAPAAKWRILH